MRFLWFVTGFLAGVVVTVLGLLWMSTSDVEVLG